MSNHTNTSADSGDGKKTPRTIAPGARAAGILTTIMWVVVISLLGFLSTRYYQQIDLSASARNTLNEASLRVLGILDSPISITAYTRPESVSGRVIIELVNRYQRHHKDLALEFVNPDKEPERVRAQNISRDGVLDLRYQGRTKRVNVPAERTISSALLSLSRADERWIAYLVGHGERDLRGQANHDLGTFGNHLLERGFKLQALNLLESGAVPDNAAVLIIGGPRVELLAEEQALVITYVDRGGNVLWLVDPGPSYGLDNLGTALGISRPEGTLIDPATQGFIRAGLGNPTFALISRYGRHAALDGFNLMTVFPGAGPLVVKPAEDWKASVLLRSGDRVWAEKQALTGSVSQDAATEPSGPFDIGLALTRPRPSAGEEEQEGDQRIVVVSDGDFLSNSALGNGGNLDLGVRLVTWLAADDEQLDIPTRSDPDLKLTLSQAQVATIGLGWFVFLPLAFGLTGLTVWLRRRNR
jgi:ABC-type uncharacterized transport system involved in gliding motility auxiliary subunit